MVEPPDPPPHTRGQSRVLSYRSGKINQPSRAPHERTHSPARRTTAGDDRFGMPDTAFRAAVEHHGRDNCRESRHLAPLETPSFTHPPLAEFGEFGTLRDDFTHGGHRWPNWERSRSWSQRTWCTKAPRSGRSPGRWA